MASIPLPALSVNTQQESPLAMYAKIQQIKAAQTQQQTAQLQQTGLEQENQQRALALKDQQTLRSIAPNHLQKDADGNVTGFDTEGLLKEAAGKGVNPQTLNQMRLGYADTVSKLATADKETRDNEQARNKTLYETLESVRSIKDPQQRQAALIQSLPTLKKQGVDISKIQANQPISDDMLDFDEAGLGMHAQMLADAKTQSETQANAAKVTAANTGAQRLQAEMPGGPMQPVEQKELSDFVANPPKGYKGTPQDFAKWKASLAPQAQVNIQAAGAAADANGNPSAIAQAIANKQMKWSEAVSQRTPMAVKNQILQQVFKLDPKFDTSEFGLEQDAAKKARSGAWADTRLAYNTALDHSDLLLKAADALDNGDATAMNSLKNGFKAAFGWSGKINYDAIANAYNHEVTSVVSKGHITDAEVSSGHATLPDNVNKETIHDVVNSYRSLMTSKRDELDKIIKAGAGNKANAVINTGSSSDAAGGGGKKVLSPAEWLKQQKP